MLEVIFEDENRDGRSKICRYIHDTFYNSIAALQSANTGACVYHLPLGSPREKIFLKKSDFRCCNSSSVEGFSLLNTGIYYHSDSMVWVNPYVPSTVVWAEKGFTLRQKGNFPKDSIVNFRIETERKTSVAIKLLAPSWANRIDVYINNINQNVEVAPNSYINFDREWKNKDEIRLFFHYDFYLKSMPDDTM